MPNDPFVEVAALTSIGPIQYLDARDQATFDAGHAPSALHVPVEEWDKAAKAPEIGFANTAYWGEVLGSLGVEHSTTAVAYDDGRMTSVWPAPVLRAMMERVGFSPGDHIVTHCEGGGRAALAAAAAVRAGYDDVRVYYLSFADWARDESCPIVRD